jgi:cell division protein FtsL
MGQVARRIEAPHTTAPAARLRLVDTPPARPPRSSSRSAGAAREHAEEARARSIFGAFVLVFAAVIVLGGVRVTLTARAAEYSLSESSLQAEIKQERIAVDALEIDRSALSTPSRIAGIAAASMSMGEPASVKYITTSDLAGSPSASPAGPTAQLGAVGALRQVVGAVVDLSAGGAQSLLVGDLGLAGSR